MPPRTKEEEQPLITLLHAWPLRGVPGVEEGSGTIEVPDVESDWERQDAMRVLHDARIAASLKCAVLTRANLVQAIRTARIVLIATHGTQSGGLVFEKDNEIGEAEVLDAEAIRGLFVSAKFRKAMARMVYVGACYSEAVGQVFQSIGVDYVVAITGSERVSNLASRAFVKTFLQVALTESASMEVAFESGIRAVETHSEIPEERRSYQRQKFTLLVRDGGRNYIFDKNETFPSGLSRDMTETSELFGFGQSRDWPRRMVGRHDFVITLIQELRKKRKVCIVQSSHQRGLGSSMVLHFFAKYLSERNWFQSISLHASYSTGADFHHDEDDAPSRLIIIDPEMTTSFQSSAFPVEAMTNCKSYVVAVVRSETQIPPGFHWVDMPPLCHFHAEQMQRLLREEMRLQPSFLSAENNPRKILRQVRIDALKQTSKWVDKIRCARKGLMSWGEFVTQLFDECVVGPQMWPRLDQRKLEEDEIAFIKARSEPYSTAEAFWEKWLEPTIATLCVLEPYWTNRSLMGLVSEEATNNVILKKQEVGSFLLRNSVREPGKVTISYVYSPGRVEKSLIAVRRSDGSVELNFNGGTMVEASLWEAIRILRGLKKVMVRFGSNITPVDKIDGFKDAY